MWALSRQRGRRKRSCWEECSRPAKWPASLLGPRSSKDGVAWARSREGSFRIMAHRPLERLMARRAPVTEPRAELLGLLQAAKQQPDDDSTRLVLADWLEENGTAADAARAEFIRLQLECAHLEASSARRIQ